MKKDHTMSLYSALNTPAKRASAPTKSRATITRNKMLRKYEVVRLTTDKHKSLGLAKGEVGTVVDIMARPVPGYTVEFHDICPENPACVTTFHRDEIELVETVSDG